MKIDFEPNFHIACLDIIIFGGIIQVSYVEAFDIYGRLMLLYCLLKLIYSVIVILFL